MSSITCRKEMSVDDNSLSEHFVWSSKYDEMMRRGRIPDEAAREADDAVRRLCVKTKAMRRFFTGENE